MTIQDFFAKNGKIRNIIFSISFSLGIILIFTYFLMGHSFIYAAPILLLITLGGLFFKPSKLWLPFCVGSMLQFGLFAGLMGYLTIGPVPGVYIDFFIGVIGYILLLTSIWQAVFGEWNLSRATNITIQVISIIGLLFSIFVVAYMEFHGVPAEETPKYRTY